MRIGRVVGKVTLSRVHPSLVGAQFKIVIPLSFKELAEDPVAHALAMTREEDAEGLSGSERRSLALNRLASPHVGERWGSELVVFDDCSASIGEWLAFSEGAEAAAAFGQKVLRPVDAFGGAILDNVSIDAEAVSRLSSGVAS